MSVPQVPPRPARSQHPNLPNASMEVPKIPPRPTRRTSERSRSPSSDNFPRSPFNEPPLGMSQGNKGGSLYASNSQNNSNVNLPQRPPSVSLPSVGQEGSEYADIDYTGVEVESQEPSHNEPQNTRNVAGDLPLHAPKPSFSKDTAKKRVATVTRTDSGQAVAAGIDKVSTPSGSTDDQDPYARSLKPKVSFRSASTASTERPSSTQAEEEQGIPEIGQRVPMYPNAGDVQAPSPSPFSQQFPAGIGFHNAGIAKPPKHHRRTPSGREVLPPGSYGLHGHGMQAADQFEQQWYAKHPEVLDQEHGEYTQAIGGARGEWALSSDDLNKLVRDTAKAAHANASAPNEQLGYETSEEYAARMRSLPSVGYKTMHSNISQPHVESPLRKASFPVDDNASTVQEVRSHESAKRTSENALESETEDDDVYIGKPDVQNTTYSRNGHTSSTEDLGSHLTGSDGYTGYGEENGYDVPILAADEVARMTGAEFMQPAITPSQSRRGSTYYTQDHDSSGISRTASRSGSTSNSRPSSRPVSIHGLNLHRFPTHEDERDSMHTPLEDVDEYEPLFPDEEGNKKPITAAQRLKQREQMKRFPSQDIWEDTPNSLQLQATVDTPEPVTAKAVPAEEPPSAVFEAPEQEAARKGEITEEEKAKLIPREDRLAKSSFKPHIQEDMYRPSMKQRFPSKDIWEDSPDSAGLTTTVGGDTATNMTSPVDAGLDAGAVVHTTGSPRDGILSGDQKRDGAMAGSAAVKVPGIPPRPNRSQTPPTEGNQQPPIPVRPPKRLHQVPPLDAKVPPAPSKLDQVTSPTDAQELSSTDVRKGPAIPERAKPPIPARPVKAPAQDALDTTPLSKVTSASSIGSNESEKGVTAAPGAPKSRPAVPARPPGSKIAALQGGFLADLNSRLKLGPQGPKPQEKEPEPEEEKAPLADARKGRAKGPVRRKPVASSSEAATETKLTASSWSICPPIVVWLTDGSGRVEVGSSIPAPSNAGPATSFEQSSNTQPSPEVPETSQIGSIDTSQHIEPAVDESIQSAESSHQEKVASPETPAADLATSAIETERNPLSVAANTPVSNAPASVDVPLQTDSQSQTGEKNITVMPDAESAEKLTATLGGKAQASSDETGDAVVRE